MEPRSNSEWMIILDHVRHINISVGDWVNAGDIIGILGTWDGGLVRFEIMVRHSPTNTNYAPFKCFNSFLQLIYETKVWSLIADWKTFKSDSSIELKLLWYMLDACMKSLLIFKYNTRFYYFIKLD